MIKGLTMIKYTLLFFFAVLSAFAHEGEHPVPDNIALKTGTYISYNDHGMYSYEVDYEYNPPYFTQVGTSNTRTYICDEEGYICVYRSPNCDKDDVIIANDIGFRFIAGCSGVRRYYNFLKTN